MLYYNPVASKKYSFNILIVGFGNIGKKHYKNLSENFPNTKLGILIKKKSKISKKNLSNFKNYVYYSLNDSLSFKPDLVLICTPANLHYKQVNFFLQNKVNIFVEKPIFEKLYNINKFQKIIKDNNLLFWVGYNLRYSKLIFQFKSLIHKKIVGDIYYVNCFVGNDIRNWTKKKFSKTISVKKNKGGGVILELSHEIDYLIWIFGNFKNVYSNYSKISNLNIDVEDNVLSIFELKNKLNKYKIFLHMDFLRKDNTRFIEVVGSKGTIRIDLILGKIELFSITKNKWKVLYSDHSHLIDSYKNQFFNFFKYLFHSNSTINNLNQSNNVLKIINSMKKSNLIKKRIKI